MSETRLEASRRLIVERVEAEVRVLCGILQQAGYANIIGTTDADQALLLYASCRPDLILLDLHASCRDGSPLLCHLRGHEADAPIPPIIVLTANVAMDTKMEAVALGARDFLSKPLDATEVLLRTRNLLEMRLLRRRLQHQAQVVEERTRACLQEIEQTRHEMLTRLALAVAVRDGVTGEHISRVGETSASLARIIGWDEPQVEFLRRAVPLHDVGKIGIPDRILLKPGHLTAGEFAQMKEHTSIGARLLGGSQAPVLQLAEVIARTHHERWDGSGYEGLRGATIPLAGRIVALADIFDALVHVRPYKPTWPLDRAMAEIMRLRGRHLDPGVVEAFLHFVDHDPAWQRLAPRAG